jgi:hypothetical protein
MGVVIDFCHCCRFKTLLVDLDDLYCFLMMAQFILSNKYLKQGLIDREVNP